MTFRILQSDKNRIWIYNLGNRRESSSQKQKFMNHIAYGKGLQTGRDKQTPKSDWAYRFYWFSLFSAEIIIRSNKMKIQVIQFLPAQWTEHLLPNATRCSNHGYYPWIQLLFKVHVRKTSSLAYHIICLQTQKNWLKSQVWNMHQVICL